MFTDLLEPDEGVRCVPDGDRLVVLMQQGLCGDDLARELSVTVTQHAKTHWIFVGDVVGAA